MTFAQLPTSTPNEIGGWLVPAAAVLGIAVLVLTGLNQLKQYRAKPVRVARPIAERFITRAEHDRVEKELTDKIVQGHKDLGEQIEKNEKYSHQRFHELGQQVHNLGLKIAEQPHDTRQMIDAALTPLVGKVDTIGLAVAAISAKMGIPINAET